MESSFAKQSHGNVAEYSKCTQEISLNILNILLISNNLLKPYQISFQPHLVTENAVDHNSP